MMARTVDFYFDFMSPYAYLAHHRLLEMKAEFGFDLRYHPIDLPCVKIGVGNTGPSNRSIPAKIAYLTTDLQRWAHRYGVPLMTPATHDSKLANIGGLIANERGRPAEYAEAVWSRTWGSGGDFASLALLRDVASSLGWDTEEFERLIVAPEWEQHYHAASDAAIAQGVFGVPIMVADGEMWWGNDRLFMLSEHLCETSITPAETNPI